MTTQDTEKVISFRADERLVRSLIAACASDPDSFEDLLLAVEPLVPGTTARVIDGLLHFDECQGARSEQSSPSGECSSPPDTFEVVDGFTQNMATRPDDDGILRIDVVNRNIEGNLASTHLLAPSGTVSAPGDLDRHTAYALNQNWNLLQVESVPQTREVARVA